MNPQEIRTPEETFLMCRLDKHAALATQAKTELNELEDEMQTLATIYNLDGKLQSYLCEHLTAIRTKLETIEQGGKR